MNAGNYYRGVDARIAGANRLANIWLDHKRLHAVQEGQSDGIGAQPHIYALRNEETIPAGAPLE